MPFHKTYDSAGTLLAADHAIGSGTLTIVAGSLAGVTPSISSPIYLTVGAWNAIDDFGRILNPAKVAIFEANGRTGDVLAVSLVSGTDQVFAAGSRVYAWLLSQHVDELQAAVAAIQADGVGGARLPDQAGHAGEVLKTDGTDPNWAAIAIADVSGLQSALDAKANATALLNYATTSYVQAVAATIPGLAGNGTAATAAHSDHNHTGVYQPAGSYQAGSIELTAVAGLNTTGFVVRTGAGTYAARALAAGDIPDLSATYSVIAHNHAGVYQPANATLTSLAAASYASGAILTGAGTGIPGTVTLGTGLSITGGVLNCTFTPAGTNFAVGGVTFAANGVTTYSPTMQGKCLVFRAPPNHAVNFVNKALTANVATLTTDAPHGFLVGDAVQVNGIDAVFNGPQILASVPTSTTFTFAKTNADVASTACTGTGYSYYFGDYWQVQDQAGTAMGRFTAFGNLILNGTITAGGAITGTALTAGTVYGGSSSAGNLTVYSTSHGTKGNLYLNGTTNFVDASGNLTLSGALYTTVVTTGAATSLRFDANGTINLLRIDGAAPVTSTFTPITNAKTVLAIRGISGQTAPLLSLQGRSSTTDGRDIAKIDGQWATSTDASRAGRLVLSASDATADREGIRIESNGTVAMVGCFGVTAVARPSLTYSRTGETTAAAQIRTALSALGLINDQTTA